MYAMVVGHDLVIVRSEIEVSWTFGDDADHYADISIAEI